MQLRKRFLSGIVAAFLVVTSVASGMGPLQVHAAQEDVVNVEFLASSDLHGQLWTTDYTQDFSKVGTYKRGFLKMATYINERRAANPNVFLGDCGDLVQGTPLTYYYAFYRQDATDPCMKALRLMDYDMLVLGNHEFNYGLSILNKQLTDLTAPAKDNEQPVAVCVANYLDAKSNNDTSKDWKTWNGYAPYLVRNYDGVSVAIMGLGNPCIPKWDVPANWQGIYFAGIEETYAHYKDELSNFDIVVIYTHNGIEGENKATMGYEDSVRDLVSSTTGIDLVFTGHAHENKDIMIKNAAGVDVPVVAELTKARVLGDVTISYDKKTGAKTYDVKRVDMEAYPVNMPVAEALASYETNAWSKYMNETIGTASGDFSALNLGVAPSAFMDLVNKIQIQGAYDNNGLNTPGKTSDDMPAMLSISAPLTSGDATEIIKQGEITLGDMFKLYRFENWFYQITMNGKEVKTWLEYAATKIKDENGIPVVSSSDLTYYDIIYGEGFSYVLDHTQPEGSRVVSMTYNGVPVTENQVFTVVVNNYRFNGGGGYVQYLNDNGCTFKANDQTRVIYSTQYDMRQGEDKGQARNLIADYIRDNKVITPVITSTWSVK